MEKFYEEETKFLDYTSTTVVANTVNSQFHVNPKNIIISTYNCFAWKKSLL